MKKYIKLYLALLCSFLFAFTYCNISSYALDTRISFSDPSAVAGSEVTVTMKITSLDGATLGNASLMLSYDTAYLEFLDGDNAQGGAGAIKIGAGADGQTEWVYNLRFRALQAGETSITASEEEVYDADGRAATVSRKGSSKINISPGESTVGSVDLQSLNLGAVSISPDFDPAVTEYTATVGAEVNTVAVSAVAADGSASVEISGGDNLTGGQNTVTVTVSLGENTKTYTIQVEKVSTLTESLSLAQITVLGKTIYIYTPDESVAEPEGLERNDNIDVNGAKVVGWLYPEDKGENFVILYGSNENGEKGFYSYDRKEKTVQRYFAAGESVYALAYTALQRTHRMAQYTIIALACLLAIVVALSLFLLLSRKRKRSRKEREVEPEPVPRRESRERKMEDTMLFDRSVISASGRQSRPRKAQPTYEEDLDIVSDLIEEDRRAEKDAFLNLGSQKQAVSPIDGIEERTSKAKAVDLDDDFDVLDWDE